MNSNVSCDIPKSNYIDSLKQYVNREFCLTVYYYFAVRKYIGIGGFDVYMSTNIVLHTVFVYFFMLSCCDF